jgi:hypothetical protein
MKKAPNMCILGAFLRLTLGRAKHVAQRLIGHAGCRLLRRVKQTLPTGWGYWTNSYLTLTLTLCIMGARTYTSVGAKKCPITFRLWGNKIYQIFINARL